ncbi:hypothetical protein B0H15DRAFT_796041 [Mycena belliarum]|uniref:Uncharacterized protein n=1 Tax=Mycena belliarum TaxID=1033014 RepID=A0AAD6Y1E0_9AGAR|nr:hypothetical protein B0H15DRAFT_796041 [Mycena belliae]
MSRSYLDQIWSRYTTSPDPLSGMESLYQACSRLTRHALQPAHVIPIGDSFTLHPDLAEPLAEVVPAMDHLLRFAARCGPHNAQLIGNKELQVLIITAGRYSYATQRQIVTEWYILMEHLTTAMRELKNLCNRDAATPSRGLRSSRAPSICISPELPLVLGDEFPRTPIHVVSEGLLKSPLPSRAHVPEPQKLRSAIRLSAEKEKHPRTLDIRRGTSASHSDYAPLTSDSISVCRRYLAAAAVDCGGLRVKMAEPRAAASVPKDEGHTPSVPISEARPSRAAPPHYLALSPDSIRCSRARVAPPGPRSKPHLREEAVKAGAATPSQRSPVSAHVKGKTAVGLGGLRDVKDPVLRPKPEALDVARVAPPPKPPAPAPAIADTVELGGLRVGVTQPRMIASASQIERGGRASVLLEMKGADAGRDARQADEAACSRMAADSSARQRLQETTFHNSVTRAGPAPFPICDTGPNQRDPASRGEKLRTRDEDSSTSIEPSPPPHTSRPESSSSPPAAPALSFDKGRVEFGGPSDAAHAVDQHRMAKLEILELARSSNILSFALVSTILRTRWIQHLVCNAHGELIPQLAWEREGIGTRHWT